MVIEDRQWVVNTLEVIVNHYRELEKEIREVRIEHEVMLSKIKCEEFILKNAVKPEVAESGSS